MAKGLTFASRAFKTCCDVTFRGRNPDNVSLMPFVAEPLDAEAASLSSFKWARYGLNLDDEGGGPGAGPGTWGSWLSESDDELMLKYSEICGVLSV